MVPPRLVTQFLRAIFTGVCENYYGCDVTCWFTVTCCWNSLVSFIFLRRGKSGKTNALRPKRSWEKLRLSSDNGTALSPQNWALCPHEGFADGTGNDPYQSIAPPWWLRWWSTNWHRRWSQGFRLSRSFDPSRRRRTTVRESVIVVTRGAAMPMGALGVCLTIWKYRRLQDTLLLCISYVSYHHHLYVRRCRPLTLVWML